MFDRLFTYLVKRINATVDDESRAKQYIGLLDVYGFEFFEVNSFEQVTRTPAARHASRWPAQRP
jgi:myosin heavy subunit